MRTATHLLSREEIGGLPAGRPLNTLVEEYVMGGHARRWLNLDQKYVACHWFEELPRACAEDDGGSSQADFLPDYSRKSEGTRILIGRMMENGHQLRSAHVAAADGIPGWEAGFLAAGHDWDDHTWKRRRMRAPTMELAVARAALLAMGSPW